MKEKKKNYKRRSRVYRNLGLLSIVLGIIGSFVAYEIIIDWNNFVYEIDNFVVVSPTSLKLNMFIALPAGLSLVILFFILRKKEKDFFKNKVSLNLIIAILICYLIYSVIETILVLLIGALGGAIFDEFLFSPLSNLAKTKYEEEKEIEIEYKKEKRRIKARQQVEVDLDGSV